MSRPEVAVFDPFEMGREFLEGLRAVDETIVGRRRRSRAAIAGARWRPSSSLVRGGRQAQVCA